MAQNDPPRDLVRGSLKTELFDYELPESQIAVRPPEERDGGKLLVLDGDELEHRVVRDFAELLPSGALLVLNDSRVRRARVLGRREPGGGRVEFLLIEGHGQQADGRERWTAIARANKPLGVGARVSAGALSLEVLERGEGALLSVAIGSAEPVEQVLEREGHVPIPPYMRRDDDAHDRERYQTVYARRTGSVAAPTAGLHLTAPALERLSARGIVMARLELAVGLGTFRPVVADDLDQHDMHSERFVVDAELATKIREARARSAPVVAVGTTVVRALESAADPEQLGLVRVVNEATRLLIQPGYRFRVVDALLTNFHQPRSTLLALIAAFAGYEQTMRAYREALGAGYRFLSYGDAMWIPRRTT